MSSLRWSIGLAPALFLAACQDASTPVTPPDPALNLPAVHDPAGAVATMSNATAGNSILVFPRSPDGTLEAASEFPTGGTGSGGGLGNQGAVAVDEDSRWLLAVNAGSHEVSVFRISGRDLQLTDRVPSGGERPISIAIHDDLVYVLNAGGSGNVTGFRLRHGGRLVAIPNSTRALGSAASGPAQVGFDPWGRRLVVTEKATNLLTLYIVGHGGRLRGPFTNPSAGQTPFGFAFDRRGRLFVSEAFGGAPDASALSSYELEFHALESLSASVGTTETAACWVVVTRNGRYAYVTNTGSGTISGYRITRGGRLRLLDGDGVTGQTGAGPIDLALTPDSRLMYSLDGVAGGISGFAVRHDGSLEALPGTSGLPASANGLVAW